MTGIEVAVGALIGWFLRKAGRAARHVDGIADDAIDVTLDRVHDVVLARLGDDSAVARMEREAEENGEVSPRTRARVRMAIEEAAEEDPAFAEELAALSRTEVGGSGNIVVQGSVRAKDSGIAIGGVNGNVTLPQGPART